MSTIKSQTEHLTINADGTGKEIKFQANGVEKAKIDANGDLHVGNSVIRGSSNFDSDSAGKVLQVVSVDMDSLLSTTSTAWQNVMSATITPSSSTSVILVMITSVIGAGGAISTGQSVWRGSTQILKGQSVSGVTASSGPSAYGGSGDANNNAQIAIIGKDSPATTSATTYYFKYRSPQSATVRVNDLGSGIRNTTYAQTSLSTITLMEIGA